MGAPRISKGMVAAAMLAAVVALCILLLRGPPAAPPLPRDAAPPSPVPAAPVPNPPAAPPEESSAVPLEAAPLEVRVVDERDRPVEGALVRLHGPGRAISERDEALLRVTPPMPRQLRAERRTDGSGRAVLEGIPAGWDWVRAEAPGFAAGTELIRVEKGIPHTAVLVVLQRSCALEGRVLCPDGKGREGVGVEGRWGAGVSMLAFRVSRTTSGPGGRYRLEGLPPGPVELSARPRASLVLEAGAVEVPAVTAYDILIQAGVTVRGRVLAAADGTPVGGADVILSLSRSTAAAVSGEDGSFALEGLPAGTGGWLHARKQGFLAFPASGSDGEALIGAMVPGGVLEKVIRLSHGGRIRGRVTAPGGVPVAGALVHASGWRTEGDALHGVSATTAGDGTYLIPAAYPGRLVIAAYAEGFRGDPEPDPASLDWRDQKDGRLQEEYLVRVPAGGEAVKDFTLVPVERPAAGPAPAPGGIEGRVRRADGGPLEGARLGLVVDAVDRASGDSEYWVRRMARARPLREDGSFRLEGLVPGTHSIYVSCPGCALSTTRGVPVEAGSVNGGIEIVLAPETVITGRVEDGGGGPVAGARVSVAGLGDGHALAVTDAEGKFRIGGLPEGMHVVVATLPGRGEVSETPPPGGEGVVLVLESRRAIAGTVADAESGEPIPGIHVRVHPEDLRGMRAFRPNDATTDSRGTFAIEGLGPGQYSLMAGEDNGSSRAATEFVPRSVQGVPAGKEDVRVLLRKGFSISGRVVDSKGDPPPRSYTLRVDGEADPGWESFSQPRRVDTAADGAFEVRALPAGTYELVLGVEYTQSETPILRRTGVRSGTRDLVLHLDESAPIEGRIEDESGSPVLLKGIVQPRLSADRSGKRVERGPFLGNAEAVEGNFRTQPLPPGEAYDLLAAGFPGFLGGRLDGVAAGARGVVIRLRRGGFLAGKVVDVQGNPVPAGVVVGAQAVRGPGREPDLGDSLGTQGMAKTGPDGTFRIECLGDYRFEVYVPHAAGSDYFSTTRGEVVSPGREDLVLRAEKGGAVSGRVVGQEPGQPGSVRLRFTQEGPSTSMNGMGFRTDAEGRFTLNGLRPGRVRIYGGAEDRLLGEFDVPSEGIEVRLPAK